MEANRALAPGDLVRFESDPGGLWYYCRVDGAGDEGHVLCTAVEAQSWPDVMLEGIFPGRQYAMPRANVLSVVRKA